MIVLEAGSPVGSLEKGLHGAGKVHEPVAHQEEHAAKPNIFKLEIVKTTNMSSIQTFNCLGVNHSHEPVSLQEKHAAKPNIFKLEIVNSKNDQYVIHSNLQLQYLGVNHSHEPVAHQEEHAAKPNIFKLEIK